MRAKKLPSGSWRARVFYVDAAGRHTKSFTAPTKKEAEYLAAEFLRRGKAAADPGRMTIGEAIDAFIAAREGVLSPSTTRTHKLMRGYGYSGIADMQLRALDRTRLQRHFSALATQYSPKTLRNILGLLSATLPMLTN